jgi:sugar (pentulose or hexulose) kinase
MILVFDLGTQSFRATVIERSGGRVFEWSRAVESRIEGAIAEQDPLAWRAAMLDAIRAIGNVPGLAASILTVTASATLSGLVCLDDKGAPLRPAILYADRRAAGRLPRIESFEEYARSGWRAYSGDFLPQIDFVRCEEAGIYAQARWLLDATGYLNYLLTGRTTLDRYTTYTCYADPLARELPLGLFSRLGIDAGKLGAIVDAGQTIGWTLPELGFARARVIGVSYDSAAAYLGSRMAEAGEALDISGTVTSFGVLSSARIVDPERRVFSIPYGAGWLVRGSTAMSGGVLEWARRTVVNGGFDEFDRLVTSSPPGARGVLFLPYLAGARAPLWEPSACGVFHGLTAQTTRADLARAVYEGLCYSLFHIVEVIESLGAAVSSIQLGGGLSRNALMNRMKADVTGRTVRPQADLELTTLGSASIAARALGWLAPGESYCRAGEAIAPRVSEAYRECFDRYRGLAARLFAREPEP